jgi:hypothetical protein
MRRTLLLLLPPLLLLLLSPLLLLLLLQCLSMTGSSARLSSMCRCQASSGLRMAADKAVGKKNRG